MTIHSLDELVSYLPFHLGFHPRRALVAVAMRGNELLFIAHYSFDDTPPGEPSAGTPGSGAQAFPSSGAQLMAVLRAHRASGVHLLVFEDHRDEGKEALATVLGHTEGLAVLSVVAIREGRAWHLRSAQGREWVDGVDLVAHPDSPAVIARLLAGAAPLADRSQVRALIDEDPDTSAGVSVALAAIAERRAGQEARGGEARQRPARCGTLWRLWLLPPEFTRASAPIHFSDAEVAALLDSLGTLSWRDALIAWAAPGSLPMHKLPGGVRKTVRRDLGDPPSDPRRVLTRLEALARRAPATHPSAVAAICAVVGCVAWHLGEGSVARDAHERALCADPGYRLSQLGLRVIQLGIRGQHPQRGQDLGARGDLAV